MKNLENFVQQIKNQQENTKFEDVIDIINQYYNYTPEQFSNGANSDKIINAAGQNEGSCKIFSFAKIHQLNDTQTLHCFGHYYRDEVLQHPENSDHGNIRTFIKHGGQHVVFEKDALTAKTDD